MLLLGFGAASVAVTGRVHAQAAAGVKMTVLYGQPKNAEEFEKYYLGPHMAIFRAVKGIRHVELGKISPKPDGSAAPFYRIAEFWFESAEQMARVTSTPEWQKVREDLPKFATGGLTVLVSKVE
jgi:uncharacterized protein (TIGR02118 family)